MGGVHPEQFNEDIKLLWIAIDSRCYVQARALALLWLARAPEDATALYYLATANWNLNDRQTAAVLYKRAIANGLSGNMLADAKAKVVQLTTAAAANAATTRE